MPGFADALRAVAGTLMPGYRAEQNQQFQQKRQAAQDLQTKQQWDQDFAQKMQEAGASPVHSGVVQRNLTLPAGQVTDEPFMAPVLDKAGSGGRPIVKHTTAEGETQAFELPTIEEQIQTGGLRALQTTRANALSNSLLGKQAAEAAGLKSGAVAQGTGGGTYAAETAERNANGIPLDPRIAATVPGGDVDAAGNPRRYLPTELGARQTSIDATTGALQNQYAFQRGNAAQDLSGVQSQEQLDRWHANPNHAQFADNVPTVYNPNTLSSAVRTLAVPVAQQPKFTLEQMTAEGMKNQNPQDDGDLIDRLAPVGQFPELNATGRARLADLRGLPLEPAAKAAARGAILKDIADQSTAGPKAAAEAKAKLPEEIAARVGTAQAMNATGPELSGVALSDRNNVQGQFQKSLTDLNSAASDANRIHGLIQAAQGGNKAAPALVPIAELRGFLNRINSTELRSVSSQAGSLGDQIEGWVKGKTEGQPVPPEILKATDQLAGLQMQNAEQKHAGEVKAMNIARGSNYKPRTAEDLGYQRPGAGNTSGIVATRTLNGRGIGLNPQTKQWVYVDDETAAK